MTTPEEFREKTMKSLKYLETILPPKSAVILTGLAEGAVLFDNLGLSQIIHISLNLNLY